MDDKHELFLLKDKMCELEEEKRQNGYFFLVLLVSEAGKVEFCDWAVVLGVLGIGSGTRDFLGGSW